MKDKNLVSKVVLKKVLVGFLVFCMFVTETLGFLPTASAEAFGFFKNSTAFAESSDPTEVYDLIALVTEKDLINGSHTLEGLITQYPDKLDEDGMEGRIARFAKDLQNTSPRTIVKTLTYDGGEENLLDVIKTLEALYKNGDENVKSRLIGVVLIGDVPLPVVNKKGNRFISMLPMTDFDDKAYIFNSDTQTFDLNPKVQMQKPEIWHGILRAPDLDGNSAVSDEELGKLAEFFDKNHLYHAGVKDFADFNKKLFYGDMVNEAKSVNEDEFQLYQNYLDHMDDIAYMRYNKKWLMDVSNKMMAQMGSQAIDPASFADMPDIYTKEPIMNYNKNYSELTTSYLQKVNDFVKGTGRYNEVGAIESIPALITMKDKFAQEYLRQANDAVERKVNELASKIATPFPIVDYAQIAGDKGDGKPFSVGYNLVINNGGLQGFAGAAEDEFNFVFTTDVAQSPFGFRNQILLKSGGDYVDGADSVLSGSQIDNFYIDGVSKDLLDSPKKCLPFLGSSNSDSTLTRSVLGDDILSAQNQYTLGITGFALSPTEMAKRTNNLFTNGFIIQPNRDYGIPAFYGNSASSDSTLKKGGLKENDIILTAATTYFVDGQFKEYKITLEDEAKFGADNLAAIAKDSSALSTSSSIGGDPLNPKLKFTFKIYAPLIECTDCKIYAKALKEDPPASGIQTTINGQALNIFPGFSKIAGIFYYLPVNYNDSSGKVISTGKNLQEIVNTFAQTVLNTKYGGSDKKKIYYDDYSFLTVNFHDSVTKTVKSVDIKIGDLVPFSTLRNKDYVYADNLVGSGKNWTSGCFFVSTVLHDDRCFQKYAMYSLINPAGSIELFTQNNTGLVVKKGTDEKGKDVFGYIKGSGAVSSQYPNEEIVYEYQFPIGKQVTEGNYLPHKETFQLPKGRSISDIDNIYMDACYNFLPSYLNGYGGLVGIIGGLITSGSGFVNNTFSELDKEGWFNFDLNRMLEVKTLNYVKKYGKKNKINPSTATNESNKVPIIKSTNEFKLDDETGITLGWIASHYGLFDGKDNDGDGVTDYQLIPGGSFQLDLGEADPKYGINPDDISMVSRLLLGVRRDWTNPPFSAAGFGEPGEGEYWYPIMRDLLVGILNSVSGSDLSQSFDSMNGVVFKVKPHVLAEIPSTIIHNEPTNYTIGKEKESGIATSLPIDDPRYIAFMDTAGQTQKIVYPSLFISQVTGKAPDASQYVNGDLSFLADQIIKIPGYEKLAGDFTGSKEEIQQHVKDFIISEIKSVSTDSSGIFYEDPSVNINHLQVMTSAEAGILKDALKWNNLSIDDKHDYILQYYLNAGKDYYPYINDNNRGYEAAYLLFDGGSDLKSDYVDMSFNKSQAQDEDPAFNIYTTTSYEEAMGPNVDEEGYSTVLGGSGGGEDEDGDKFVNLARFFKEIMQFYDDLKNLVNNFDPKIGLQYACENGKCTTENCDNQGAETLAAVKLTAKKDIIYSDGNDSVDIEIQGLNQENTLYLKDSPTIVVNISQDALNPIFELDQNFTSKALNGGKAIARLKSTKISGDAAVTVQAIVDKNTTVTSEPLKLHTSGKKVELVSDMGSVQVGTDDVATLTANLIANDQLETSATNQATFKIIQGADSAEFDGPSVVDAQNGSASVDLKPLSKMGIVTVEARVTSGGYYAVGQKDIIVGSGEISQINLNSSTDTLISNNKSAAHLKIALSDKFNNTTADQLNRVAVFAFGDAVLDTSEDQNPGIAGVELLTTDGVASVDLIAKDKIGEVDIYALYLTSDLEEKLIEAGNDASSVDFKGAIGTSKKLRIIGDASLQTGVDNSAINADGISTTKIYATLTETNGTPITGYNGDIIWQIKDPSLGSFVDVPAETMTNGKSEITFKSSTKSGIAEISIKAPGFTDTVAKITTLPGPPAKLQLTSDSDSIYTNSNEGLVVTAKLLDKYDNLTTEYPTSIEFEPTLSSMDMITLDGALKTVTSNGTAAMQVKAKSKSGVANIKVKAAESTGGVEPGKLTLNLKKRISDIGNLKNFEKVSPRALYINLLGGPFYDLGMNDLGSSLLYNGQSEAVLTQTADASDKKRVVSVDGYGAIEILDSNVSSTIVTSDKDFNFSKVRFDDNAFDETIGEVFVVPKDGLPFVLLNGENFDNYKEGILVIRIGDNEAFPKFTYNENGNEKTISITKNNKDLAKIDQYGRTDILSPDITLRIPAKDDIDVDKFYFSLLIDWKGTTIGQIEFKQQDAGVKFLSSKDQSKYFQAGIYLKLNDDYDHFAIKSSFSRYSTNFNRGAYFVDLNNDLDPSMAPGNGYASIEGAKSAEGVGFSTDNKNMLLFAAGNTAGESNLPYASEVGVLLGDPTVRINNSAEGFVTDSGYTKDIGQMIYSESSKTTSIVPFDYNGDGYDDLLIVLDDGRIRLLGNEISNKRFVDRGIVLYLPNKIYSLAKLDIDKDGFDDLIIGTQESCIQGEKALYLYKNNHGNFDRQGFKLNTADKIYEIQTYDLNKDGAEDLAVTDSSGSVYVFWTEDGKINPIGQKLGNFGLNINQSDLIEDILVNYPGMKPAYPAQGASDAKATQEKKKFVNILIQPEPGKETASTSESEQLVGNAESASGPSMSTTPFLLPGYISTLSGSIKTAVDVNGAPLAVSDIIEYTITIKNNGGAINDMIISDITPSMQEIDKQSIKCLDANCSDNLRFVGADAVLREWVIKGISVSAYSSRRISYQAKVLKTPKINVTIGNFAGMTAYYDTHPDDGYSDILVNSDGNSDGNLHFFFSNGLDSLKHVNYTAFNEPVFAPTFDTTPPLAGLENIQKLLNLTDANSDEDEDEDEGDEEDSVKDPDSSTPQVNKPPEALQTLMDKMNGDDDYDMIPDTWDEVKNSYANDYFNKNEDSSPEKTETEKSGDDGYGEAVKGVADAVGAVANTAGKVANVVSETIDAMRCKGAGCLPTPYNHAFLAPGKDDNGSSGIALFAAGTPTWPVFFNFFWPTSSTSSFRIYLSPTLTLGLGIAACGGGPNGKTGMCFIGALPSIRIPAVCDAIDKALASAKKAISTAVNTVNNAVNKVTALISNGSDSGPDQGKANSTDIQHNGSYGSPNSKLKFEDSINLKIPGFPSFFTNWLDAQIEEIYTKLLDLPDFYLILPDFGNLISTNAKAISAIGDIQDIQGFFKALQQIPLIQIEGKEVKIKIPVIQQDQIEKYQRQALLLEKHIKEQIQQIKEFWTCDKSAQEKTICDSAILKMNRLIASVQKVLDTLEYYKDLPKKILQLRTAETKYAIQIICYLDAVMELTSGYIKKQGRTIKSWIKAVKTIVDQFKSWKSLFDLVVEYEESCDQCKNERYSQIGMLFQMLGSAFPDLPIIQIPKWPDFIFDFSKMEMGMKIIWPDFVFKPEPLNLPDLPVVNLPKIMPSVEVDIPGFDISKYLPPMIDINLPDLPPLPLPIFPDIPRPPKIPQLPKAIYSLVMDLKPIFKILCLIKKGLFVFPELTMKAEVEELTMPGVKPVLPITLNLNMSLPSFSYEFPAEFEVTLKSKFGASTSIIYDAVKNVADKMNYYVTKWVDEFNKMSSMVTGGLKSAADYTNIEQTLREQLGIGPDWEIDSKKLMDEIKGDSSYNYDPATDLSNKYLLAADQTFLNSNDPILNKDLSGLDFINPVDSETGIYSKTADLRNSLLAYAKDLENSNETLKNIQDIDQLSKIIVDGNSELKLKEGFADINLTNLININKPTSVTVKSFPMYTGFEAEAAKYSSNSKKLIAAIDLKSPGSDALFNENAGVLTEETVNEMETPTPPGLFVFYNGENQNVLSYVNELNKESQIKFMDADNDGDTDIIFTMGNDIYLKKNYTSEDAPPSPIKQIENPVSISDYLSDKEVSDTSVQGLTITGPKNNSVGVSFTPQKNPDVVAYELIAYPSLIDIDKNSYNGTYHYLLTENPRDVFGVVEDVLGIDNFIYSTERKAYPSLTSFEASAGDIIYAASDSGFILSADKPNVYEEMTLNKGKFFKVPDNYASKVKIDLVGGELEVIKKGGEIIPQFLKKTSFVFGDKIAVGKNGGANLTFTNGALIDVHENEKFEMLQIKNKDNPIVQLSLPNGNYYSVIYAISKDGKKSLVSTQTPLSPQICGTTSAPLPALSNTDLTVAVTKTLELNASSSFDPSGADIKSYYIDLNPEADSNGDGDKTNDSDLWSDKDVTKDGFDKDGNPQNDMDNPLFKLGPYEQVGPQDVVLNIVNTANIRSLQPVHIDVYVPGITFSPASIAEHSVSGNTYPVTSDMPLSIIRSRYLPRVEGGKLKLVPSTTKVVTPSADQYGQYLTQGDGSYSVSDFNLDNSIEIKDSTGKVVVEINGVTGNYSVIDPSSTCTTIPANPPVESTKVECRDKSGKVVGTLYFVSDANSDVAIHQDMDFNAEKVKDMSGVHVSDLNSGDSFEFRAYPANDPNYPGGVYLYYLDEKKQMAAIDTAGNILLLDNRMTLTKKENSYTLDPFVYSLLFNGKKVAEIYVSPKGKFEEVQIVGPNETPKKFPNGVTPSYLFEESKLNPKVASKAEAPAPFQDLSGDLYDLAMNLYKQGFLAGSENFNPNALISRADFVIIILNMICVVPRPESYTSPSPFSDIDYNEAKMIYYYPYVKEGALIGIIHGYEQPGQTLYPFMPTKTINLAEAVKVIVDGLGFIGVIDVNKVNASPSKGAWYSKFIDAALNLSKYAKSGVKLKNSFIITPEEAQNPDKELTRGEVLKIASRVIDSYNCVVIDANNNGMSDFCEKKYNITDPNGDEDNDDLTNKEECTLGTSPIDPDTDHGGVKDGDEVKKFNTNPLDPIDDQNDTDGDGLTDAEELYIYHTDPNNPDTDNGGINDGVEVKKNKTDPLNGADDYSVGGNGAGKMKQIYESEAGVYLVPAECNTCPCNSTIDYKADLRKGDVLYTIIVNRNETIIYSKSNEQKVN